MRKQYLRAALVITTIALNRPHRRNAADVPTAQKLWLAFLAFENDPKQKVCVFYGVGGNFCAGFDLQERAKLGDRRNLGPCGPTRMIIKKPVICAVARYVVAGGLELSLLGDIRVAEEDAVFGLSLGDALDIAFTGRPVGAQEALTMGLANRSCYYSAWESKSFFDALSQEFDRGTKIIEPESIGGASRFSSGEDRHGSFKNGVSQAKL
ncbi:ClpP/crotonase-like domain-containing protein [Bisporella sp. PMI_857]|nr:ClpP/crotonase-like domain-containing protein [Bisporella sp. PMI_857]